MVRALTHCASFAIAQDLGWQSHLVQLRTTKAVLADRTFECRYQKPMPYVFATPQSVNRGIFSLKLFILQQLFFSFCYYFIFPSLYSPNIRIIVVVITVPNQENKRLYWVYCTSSFVLRVWIKLSAFVFHHQEKGR